MPKLIAAPPKRKAQLPLHFKKKKAGTSPPAKKVSSTGGCTKERLFAVIAQLSSLHGGGGAPRELVAKRAGYGNPKSQAFTKALSRQTKNGFLTTDGDLLILTEAGEGLAEKCDDLSSDNETQLAKIEASLSAKQRDLFLLLRSGGSETKKHLADALDYENAKVQGFTKLLSRVKAQGYLEDAPGGDRNSVQLSDLCFPFGRPEGAAHL